MRGSFDYFIAEVKGEQAHKQAVDMGLKYRGFGYWEDPVTGETKYKTVNDQLVAVEPDVESERADPVGDKEGGGMPGGGPEAVGSMGMGAQMAQGQQQQVPGTNVLGAPEPGEELVPADLSWEPGPDGSTCIGADETEEPAAVPEDAFVSRTNNMKWGAGPDGTNYSNIDYGEILKGIKENTLNMFMKRLTIMEAMPKPKKKTKPKPKNKKPINCDD